MIHSTFLHLEFNDSFIRYAFTQPDKQTVSLLAIGTTSFQLDVSAEGAVQSHIAKLIKQVNIRPNKVYVSLATTDVHIRCVNFPVMSDKELEEAIAAQAEKIPVFHEQEYDFISSKYLNERGQLTTVFGIVPKKYLSYILKEINEIPLAIGGLELAPLNTKEILRFTSDYNPNEPCAFLTIQEKQSILAVSLNGNYRTFYRSAVGMDTLRPEKADSEINELALANLASEIQRVLRAHAAENKNEVVKNLWLIWDQNQISDLHTLLKEKMRSNLSVLTVKEIPALTWTAADPNNDKDLKNPVFLQYTSPDVLDLLSVKPDFPSNFFFHALKTRNCIMQTLSMIAGCIVVFGGIMGFLTFGFMNITKNIEIQAGLYQAKTRQILKEAEPLIKEREEYYTARKILLEQATYVNYLNRISWAQVLSVVSENMPLNLALMSFDFSTSGQASFKGNAFSVEAITELQRRIDTSSVMGNAKFDYLNEQKKQDMKVYDFSIFAQLKRSAEKQPQEQK